MSVRIPLSRRCCCAIGSSERQKPTESRSLGGLDRVTSPEFPFNYIRGIGVYVRITDAAGGDAIRMDLVRLEDERTVGRLAVTTVIVDRRGAHELILDLPRVPFERPGEYEFRSLANSRFVGAAGLLVEDAEEEDAMRESITIIVRGPGGKTVVQKIYPDKPFMLPKPIPADPKN